MPKGADSTQPGGLSKYSLIFIVLVLGIIAGLGAYQVKQKGFIPDIPKLPDVPSINQRIINEESSVIDVSEKSSSSVVAIGATQRIFNPFSGSQTQSATIGTGFIVSIKGIIVTNRHVVDDTTLTYSVIDRDGKKYEISKIYRDPVLDLAIVQVNNSSLESLELGDSSKLKVGQSVVAIGNALGRFTNTVTTGVVSGLGRRVVAGDIFGGSSESLDNLIQTDAAINPGNSGGPLLNLSGQVIGVNVAVTEGAQNIGFAIPINSVKKIVEEFERTGTVSRPYLGISYVLVTEDESSLYDMPQGAFIQNVAEGSGAQKAGLKRGDIIIKIDNQDINEENKVSQIIASKKVGDIVTLLVWNSGSERTVTATLQESPDR